MQSPAGVLTEKAGKHLKGQGEAHDEEFAPKSTAHQWQHSEGTGLLDIKSGKTLLPIWYTSWTGFAAHFFSCKYPQTYLCCSHLDTVDW